MTSREEILSGEAEPCAGESVNERAGKSTLVSRNITVVGRRTSVRLEPEMWTALREIARREGCKIHDICSLIHLRKKPDTSLTAAIRVFLMLYYRAASTEEGHRRAGHGNFDFMVQRAHVTSEMMTWRRSRHVPPLQRNAVIANHAAHQQSAANLGRRNAVGSN
ncbi:MAG: ribbon-helix-helix domain-containing protein [Micavibrio aeruginosavorus]|uniref:Ribbon-helix-helix domain-containing protein n=1 Tax=Micavibrio aeruginosavorus TaxID=349221 RepID=A0A7T5R150_9BACT|nr:MAG: ribbon-helix-helix domain-containing protein [Micavibrio aeruginosavorus]